MKTVRMSEASWASLVTIENSLNTTLTLQCRCMPMAPHWKKQWMLGRYVESWGVSCPFHLLETENPSMLSTPSKRHCAMCHFLLYWILKPNIDCMSMLANMRWTGAHSGSRQSREGITLCQLWITRCGDVIPCIQRGTVGHQRCNIILEIKHSWSRTTIFGSYGPCKLALNPHTTTPHYTTDGYHDGPPNSDWEVMHIPGVKNQVADTSSCRPDFCWERCPALVLEVTAAGEWIDDMKADIVDDKLYGPIAHSLPNPSPCPPPSTASTKEPKLWVSAQRFILEGNGLL